MDYHFFEECLRVAAEPTQRCAQALSGRPHLARQSRLSGL